METCFVNKTKTVTVAVPLEVPKEMPGTQIASLFETFINFHKNELDERIRFEFEKGVEVISYQVDLRST